MKKLKYERAEIEVTLLDPNLDIIVTSGNSGPGGNPWGRIENSIINED